MAEIGRRQALISMLGGGLMGPFPPAPGGVGVGAVSQQSAALYGVTGELGNSQNALSIEKEFAAALSRKREELSGHRANSLLLPYSGYDALKSLSPGWRSFLKERDLMRKRVAEDIRHLEREFQSVLPVAYAAWKALNA